jgi:hypothetical protein
MSDSLRSGFAPSFLDEAYPPTAALPQSYSLDNAAVIMPAVTTDVCTSLFHISADLDEDVDRERLQRALDRVCERLPYFTVQLERGLFWYRLVPAERRPLVEDEPESPCQGFNPNRPGTCLFRIRARGSRISGEFSHLVADGKGGMRFLKTLVAEYCRLSGSPAREAHPDVYSLSQKPRPGEYEDAYIRHFKPGLPLPVMGRPAFRIPGALLPVGDYRITTGRFPLATALAIAKARGVTLTELVAAAYVEALQRVWLASSPRERRRTEIAVEIPIDMRHYYPTETNRNFTLFAVVGEDMRLGPRSFENILERLKLRFRLENDEPNIARQISRNVAGMQNPLVGIIPLPLKDLGAKILFSALGEDYVSGVVTNLGKVDFPSGVGERVVRFDLAQPPSNTTKANVAIHSFGATLFVTVCSLAEGRDMESFVFERLSLLGLAAELECNLT